MEKTRYFPFCRCSRNVPEIKAFNKIMSEKKKSLSNANMCGFKKFKRSNYKNKLVSLNITRILFLKFFTFILQNSLFIFSNFMPIRITYSSSYKKFFTHFMPIFAHFLFDSYKKCRYKLLVLQSMRESCPN